MSIKPANSILLSLLCGASLAYLPAMAKPPATAAQSDTAFLAMAAQADMTSAHLGQLAETRAVESKVKDFAKTLSQDHTADYQQLSELSTKTGDAIPKAIDKQNGHTITTLDRYTGKTFDREFLNIKPPNTKNSSRPLNKRRTTAPIATLRLMPTKPCP